MARRPDVQYVQFYTDGSAARKLELVQPQIPRKKPVHRKHHRKCRVIRIDPVAVAGVVLSFVMLIMMWSGIQDLRAARAERTQMENYVHALTAENAVMQSTVDEGYDLETVKTQALALGMVPAEEVEHIVFEDNIEVIPTEHSFWEQIQNFFTALFA